MINPTKPLFRWGPIEYKIFYGAFFNEALWVQVPQVYPWPWPDTYGLFDQGRCTFVLEEEALRDAGEKYFIKYFLNKNNFKKQWLWWENWLGEFAALARTLETINLRKLSKDNLAEVFETFYKFNILFWVVVHVPEVANWGGERMLQKKLEGIDKEKAKEYLEILSAPVKYSFFQKEQMDLLNIGLKTNQGKRESSLVKHAVKYRWLLNSYGGNRVLNKSYFKEELRRLLKKESATVLLVKHREQIKENKKRQSDLAKKLHLSQGVLCIAAGLRESIWWQDFRKSYIWQMNYYWDKILVEVARRCDWKFDDLLWCYPEEVLRIIAAESVDRAKICQRSKQYVALLKAGGRQEFYGKTAIQIIKRFEPKVNHDQGSAIRGLVVSRGKREKITGKVTIISNPFTEGKKMKQGDILIAPMTSPEFIVVMRKASAIITDQGGMTCHAAIVSRELGLPCIVNTKFATKVFKDGDKIELDINKGEVRKI